MCVRVQDAIVATMCKYGAQMGVGFVGGVVVVVVVEQRGEGFQRVVRREAHSERMRFKGRNQNKRIMENMTIIKNSGNAHIQHTHIKYWRCEQMKMKMKIREREIKIISLKYNNHNLKT